VTEASTYEVLHAGSWPQTQIEAWAENARLGARAMFLFGVLIKEENQSKH